MKNNSRTTNAAITLLISYVVMVLSKKLGFEIPPDVRDAIIFIVMAYGLHQAENKPPKPKKNIKKSTVIGVCLLLIFCISFNGTCSRSQVETVHAASKQVVDKLEVNANLPQQLFEQGLIDEALKIKLQDGIADATIVAKRLRDDLQTALQTQDPGALANLAPVLANLIELIRILRIDGEKFPKLEKALVKVEAGLRIISIFFRDNIKPAVSPISNEEYARQSSLDTNKALELRNHLQTLQRDKPEAVRVILEFAE